MEQRIARVWKGVARPGAGVAYVRHLVDTVGPELSAIDGYRGMYVLRRPITGGEEFMVVTLWSSHDAIQQFAGPDPAVAVIAPAARALLGSFDATVAHYDVVASPEAEGRG